MIYFFTPYSFEKKLFQAIDRYMSLLPDPQDWGVIMDGDIAFLRADFGHHIEKYIHAYPGTGLFTCYSSRNPYQYLIPRDGNDQSDSILFHKEVADQHAVKMPLQVKELNENITGHLMVIRKDRWLAIRDRVAKATVNETIEAIDTAISKAIIAHRWKILVMRGIYVFHYCRFKDGYRFKKHLGYNMHLNIVTPCSRPGNLYRIAQSINIQRTNYTWWIIVDGAPGSLRQEQIPRNARIIYHQDQSKVGNGQRNAALDLIKSGYVFFLDDDTLLHPKLYQMVESLENDFIHFDQCLVTGQKRIGGQIRLNQVDSGSVVCSRALIGEIRWDEQLYNADGHFWQEVFKKSANPVYIPQSLSIYNALEKKKP